MSEFLPWNQSISTGKVEQEGVRQALQRARQLIETDAPLSPDVVADLKRQVEALKESAQKMTWDSMNRDVPYNLPEREHYTKILDFSQDERVIFTVGAGIIVTESLEVPGDLGIYKLDSQEFPTESTTYPCDYVQKTSPNSFITFSLGETEVVEYTVDAQSGMLKSHSFGLRREISEESYLHFQPNGEVLQLRQNDAEDGIEIDYYERREGQLVFVGQKEFKTPDGRELYVFPHLKTQTLPGRGVVISDTGLNCQLLLLEQGKEPRVAEENHGPQAGNLLTHDGRYLLHHSSHVSLLPSQELLGKEPLEEEILLEYATPHYAFTKFTQLSPTCFLAQDSDSVFLIKKKAGKWQYQFPEITFANEGFHIQSAHVLTDGKILVQTRESEEELDLSNPSTPVGWIPRTSERIRPARIEIFEGHLA